MSSPSRLQDATTFAKQIHRIVRVFQNVIHANAVERFAVVFCFLEQSTENYQPCFARSLCCNRARFNPLCFHPKTRHGSDHISKATANVEIPTAGQHLQMIKSTVERSAW